MKMRNFIRAESKDRKSVYFNDDQGRCWYEYRGQFKKKYIVVFEEKTGLVLSLSEGVQGVYPSEGTGVVDLDTIPDGAVADLTWMFDGTKIVRHKEMAIKKKVFIGIEKAKKNISSLQMAVDVDLATEEEMDKLKQWKKYSVLLSRIKPEDDKILWPEEPR